ncbi:MAG TPA: hypothetical protein VMW80_12270 [Candidatus Dormibacteraeota bacterium]|nr:hypothetical protein [Candidatus Dormibacteraeota bacterium]
MLCDQLDQLRVSRAELPRYLALVPQELRELARAASDSIRPNSPISLAPVTC